MTSAAETPSPLWMPVGMPRPLSQTVHGAVGVERDRDFVGMAGERLVDSVVDDLVDHVVKAGAVVGVADIHAGALAHGIEALEDLDRLGAIIAAAFAIGLISFMILRVSQGRVGNRKNRLRQLSQTAGTRCRKRLGITHHI